MRVEVKGTKGQEYFLGKTDISLVDRIFFLYYRNDALALSSGQFLSLYPFIPANIDRLFSIEPELHTYIRQSMKIETNPRRLVYCNGKPNPDADYASWSEPRLKQAQLLRKEYILELLPLTLRVLYSRNQPHFWYLQRCGTNIDRIYHYLQGAIYFHLIDASRFAYNPKLSPDANGNRFFAYMTKSLHQKEIIDVGGYDFQLETDFLGLSEIEETRPDIIEQVDFRALVELEVDNDAPVKTKRRDWRNELPDVINAYPKRKHLLTPLQVKIMDSLIKGLNESSLVGIDLKEIAREIGREIGSTSVPHNLWVARRVILGQASNATRSLLQNRKNHLEQMVRQVPPEGRIPGFSPTDTKILIYYSKNWGSSQQEIADAVGISKSTVKNAIRKLDIRINMG